MCIRLMAAPYMSCPQTFEKPTLMTKLQRLDNGGRRALCSLQFWGNTIASWSWAPKRTAVHELEPRQTKEGFRVANSPVLANLAAPGACHMGCLLWLQSETLSDNLTAWAIPVIHRQFLREGCLTVTSASG